MVRLALLVLALSLVAAGPAGAAISTTALTTDSAPGALLGAGMTAQGAATLTAFTATSPFGSYTGATWNAQFASGVIVSSGDMYLAGEPASTNYRADNSVDNGSTASDPDLVFATTGHPQETVYKNVAELTLDAVPAGGILKIPFIFGSEEYSQGQTPGEDRMTLSVNGQQCAFAPDGQRVTTLTINSFTQQAYYVNNSSAAAGTPGVYGLTTPLLCRMTVTPGQVAHIKIGVCDVKDTILDSGVLIPLHGIVSDRAPAAALGGGSGEAPFTAGLATGGTGDPEGMLASWSVNFGDGADQTGSGAPPASIAHTYTSAGQYTATLTVTDAEGQTAQATNQVSVTAHPVPTATATVSPAPMRPFSASLGALAKRSALKRGVTLRVTASAASLVKATLRVRGKTAGKLSTALTTAGTRTLHLRLSAAARKRLARRARTKASLSVVFTPLNGAPIVVKRSLTLTRR